MNKNNIVSKAAATVLFLFAGLTFFLSTSVIMDLFGIREREGNYVLFVVWANWLCSLLYFAAVYGLLKNKKWAAPVLLTSLFVLLATFAGLQFHIRNGGIYEPKTVKALLFRSGITLVFFLIAYFHFKKRNRYKPERYQ